VASWLPQNDILGHNKTKLFINHGGGHGLMEAAYHGVPMICAPFFGDQYDNAYIAKRKGFAEVVNLDTITADELVDIINRVISNQRYIAVCCFEKLKQLLQAKHLGYSTLPTSQRFWSEVLLSNILIMACCHGNFQIVFVFRNYIT